MTINALHSVEHLNVLSSSQLSLVVNVSELMLFLEVEYVFNRINIGVLHSYSRKIVVERPSA